ncbi:unnamed protein product [Chrysoparadoxa australica]
MLYMMAAPVLLTNLLALGRVAPVQVQLGLGHPCTIGSESMDYVVGSELMETETSIMSREKGDWHETDTGDGIQDYTEQFVMLDTFSGAHDLLAHMPSASAAEEVLSHLGHNLTHKGTHIYHAVQFFKKMHPSFDQVLEGILRGDPQAVILVSQQASQALSGRWNETLSHHHRARLVEVPPLEEAQHHALVAASHVFLAPFGWGAGITSYEALTMCVPVVALPSAQFVMQFTRGQLLQADSPELLAEDISDYIEIAIRVASNEKVRERMASKICAARSNVLGQGKSVAREWEAFFTQALELCTQR